MPKRMEMRAKEKRTAKATVKTTTTKNGIYKNKILHSEKWTATEIFTILHFDPHFVCIILIRWLGLTWLGLACIRISLTIQFFVVFCYPVSWMVFFSAVHLIEQQQEPK